MKDTVDNLAAHSISSRFNQTVKHTFLSLRNRNFRLFFIGQMISNTGNWLTNIALTLLVLNLTHSGLAVGLLAAFQYGPILFLSAWAGAIADDMDKRKLLLVTQTLEMGQSIALAIIAFTPNPSIPALFVVAMAGGVFLAFDNPLRRSFVSEMVRPEDLPNAVVLYSTIVNVSRAIGPALAGFLVVTLGYGWAFTLDAGSYIAVIICLIMMRPAELFKEPHKPHAKGAVREGLRYIMSVPTLWISFVMLALIGTLSYNFSVTLPLFVTHGLHGSDGDFTFLYTIFSVGAVVASLVVANRGFVQMRHILYGAAALGITMLILAAAPNVGIALPLMFLVGVASILYMTATTTLAQVESKREMHGRVLALQTVLLIGPTAIGGPILGWISDTLGAQAPMIIGGIVCLLAAAWGYYATHRTTKPHQLDPVKIE
ncbi:MAG: MFS transporter [Anaerolineae bacterium]|nr:MFS transporter [Anaerolineae bacterium]